MEYTHVGQNEGGWLANWCSRAAAAALNLKAFWDLLLQFGNLETQKFE